MSDIDSVPDYIVKRATGWLSSQNWQTRVDWAERARTLGAPEIVFMDARENLNRWSRWIALELVHQGLIDGTP